MHPSQKPYKKIRVVVECMAPADMTEKDLIWKLREILKWPVQLSRAKGRRDTIVRLSFKRFSRVMAYERSIMPTWWNTVLLTLTGKNKED